MSYAKQLIAANEHIARNGIAVGDRFRCGHFKTAENMKPARDEYFQCRKCHIVATNAFRDRKRAEYLPTAISNAKRKLEKLRKEAKRLGVRV